MLSRLTMTFARIFRVSAVREVARGDEALGGRLHVRYDAA
jgi:hypothetical protein